jgi:hypothetical protein
MSQEAIQSQPAASRQEGKTVNWNFFCFAELGLELKDFTLSHFTQPFFCERFF